MAKDEQTNAPHRTAKMVEDAHSDDADIVDGWRRTQAAKADERFCAAMQRQRDLRNLVVATKSKSAKTGSKR
jgi:hypothetical protein